jgi:membrane-bound metal-dependent hydrolase YbcI (DUF457 family)
MLPIGHAALGSALAAGTAQVLNVSPSLELIAAGAVLGNLPDIDLFFNGLKSGFSKGKFISGHREILHYPVIFTGAGVLAGFILGGLFWALVVGFCVLGHFLADSFGSKGVYWLYPFSKKRFLFPIALGLSDNWPREKVAELGWLGMFKFYYWLPTHRAGQLEWLIIALSLGYLVLIFML